MYSSAAMALLMVFVPVGILAVLFGAVEVFGDRLWKPIRFNPPRRR